MTTPACHDFAVTAANRFLLGFLESTVNPGFVLIMSMWYTSAEQPLRLEAYYCTNGIATMFGGANRIRSGPHHDRPATMDVHIPDLRICEHAHGDWDVIIPPGSAYDSNVSDIEGARDCRGACSWKISAGREE